jgi:transposase
MDERVLFVADYVREIYSFCELRARYGVSRKTGYKWVDRYRREGVEGLGERSRRPQRQPTQLPYAMQQAIIELRGSRRTELGPKKIQARLRERYPDQPAPSRTTIYNVLKRAGLIPPRHIRRRVAPSGGDVDGIKIPNGLWSADYKGEFLTGDGRWCYPLTVMDHASRYSRWVAARCQARAGPRRGQCSSGCFAVTGCPNGCAPTMGYPVRASAPPGSRACRSGGFGWALCLSASSPGIRSRTGGTSACTAR